MLKQKRHKAFTLAEVLITIGIIGIVAEITIPTLIQNFQAQANVVGLKRAYSILSQAYLSATNDNGTPDTWSTGLSTSGSSTGALNIFNVMVNYFRVSQNCGINAGCTDNINYLFLNNSTYTTMNATQASVAKAILADGSVFITYSFGGNCDGSRGTAPILQNNLCGIFAIDVNGLKAPNKEGVDLFEIYITKNNGLIPRGIIGDSMPFETTCQNGSDGRGCGAWVIYNGNEDYLKSCASSLAWSGPISCQ